MKKINLLAAYVLIAVTLALSPMYAEAVEIAGANAASLLSKVQSAGELQVIVKLDMDYTPEARLSSPAAVLDQKNRISKAQNALVERMAAHRVAVKRRFGSLPFISMAVDSDALKLLLNDPSVAVIQENIPEPLNLDLSIPFINADALHIDGYDGSGYAVAVLDTGVRKTHEFLDDGKVISEACYSSNYTGTAPDFSPYTSTTVCPNGQETQIGPGSGVNCDTALNGCSHGTHVAGIAAGIGGVPGTGVALAADIIAIQVFSRFESTYYCGSDPCTLTWRDDQIAALHRIYDLRNTYNIAAVNMSLGGGRYYGFCDDDLRREIIDDLRDAGIATVISSGNNGYNDSVGAPGCISSAITVGATENNSDMLAGYSNHATMVDVLAPGSAIYSSTSSADNTYESWNGTSMAAPHVAGAFAVMKSYNPNWTVTEIENRLKMRGKPVTRAGITKLRIDLETAVGTFPWASFLPAMMPKTKWGADNNVCCHEGLASFNLTMGGTTKSSTLNSCSTDNSSWEGWQMSGPGRKDFTWTITSNGCGSLSGSFSYILEVGKEYLFYANWTGSGVDVRVVVSSAERTAGTSDEDPLFDGGAGDGASGHIIDELIMTVPI